MNNILVLSHHRKITWQRCRLLHYFKYELKYRKPNWKLEFLYGQAIHRVLELYYSDKSIPLKELIESFNKNLKDQVTDDNLLLELGSIQHSGSQLLTIYHKITHDQENFEIVAIEQPYLILVDYNGNLCLLDNIDQAPNFENRFFVMSGKIDMVIKDIDGNYLIWDNKTTSMEEDTFINMMMDDEQLLDYSIYGRLKWGDSFNGVVVNGLNKNLKPKPIFRHYFSYSDEEINYAINNYVMVASEYYALKDNENHMQLRNQQFDCRGCEFNEPSMLKRKGRNWEYILDMFYEKYEIYDWESHDNI